MIFNKINGKEINPMGKQKSYLLSIFRQSCKCYGIDFNGYGYSNIVRDYQLAPQQRRKYNSLKPKITKPQKSVSVEEKLQNQYTAWTKRLSALAGITIEQAEIIADEKDNYKNDRIQMMIERNNQFPSIKRGKLIRKMERENPLRRIVDENHAQAILAASKRHKETSYEYLLDEARDKALLGEIDRSEVKEYAINLI